jgi:hypothetical protein
MKRGAVVFDQFVAAFAGTGARLITTAGIRRTMVEGYGANQQQKALGSQRRADGPRSADRDGEPGDIL